MNNETKIEKYYSSTKMQRAIMYMEQFWLLSQNTELNDADKKCAKALFEHYRRLAMCILMKEMPEKMITDLIIDVDYMQNVYKKYAI
jgi:hypothetical protein